MMGEDMSMWLFAVPRFNCRINFTKKPRLETALQLATLRAAPESGQAISNMLMFCEWWHHAVCLTGRNTKW